MKIVVTGGAGFIGSHIVSKLLSKAKVKVIDNLFTGKLENIKSFLDKIEFVRGDIRNLAFLKKEFKNTDYVIHIAAIPKVPFSIKYPLLISQVNIIGTLNVLIAARDNKVRRVIYSSSSSVYGDAKLPLKEGNEKEPFSPYALTKLVGEHYCRLFYELYGLETVSLRLFNVFGEKQDPYGGYAAVIPRFIDAILHGKRLLIYGDGKQSRDFTYVKDVADATIMALKAEKKKVTGEVFNIAYGKTTNLLELVRLINKFTGKSIKPKFTEARKGDIKKSLADISKAKRLLGYKPKSSLEQGLKKTIKWIEGR